MHLALDKANKLNNVTDYQYGPPIKKRSGKKATSARLTMQQQQDREQGGLFTGLLSPAARPSKMMTSTSGVGSPAQQGRKKLAAQQLSKQAPLIHSDDISDN